jgi:predicted PurR-regulated permease PerM
VVLSGQAIRGVAMGVVVTAFVQAMIGERGPGDAGVPATPVLTALMFHLAVAQIGAVPVLIIPIIWLYMTDSPGWGSFWWSSPSSLARSTTYCAPSSSRRGPTSRCCSSSSA